ncbi:MAG: GspH/FimT family pseudopilin [Candidatus Accumulibacter sp.]|nr:GspH/FimT family pseudopilin [Accumulibacter sp.]
MKRTGGFTLVELAVTLAVLGIILGIAVPSFASWLLKLQIRNAAEGMLHGLQLARTEAIKRNSPVTLTLTGGTGWTITDGSGAVMQARPSGEGSQAAFITVTTPSESFPFPMTFSSLGRLTSAGATTPVTGATLSAVGISGADCTAAGPESCLVVQVSVGGQIRMCDPSPSATPPRAC